MCISIYFKQLYSPKFSNHQQIFFLQLEVNRKYERETIIFFFFFRESYYYQSLGHIYYCKFDIFYTALRK